MSTSLAKVNAIYGSKHKKKQRGRVRAKPKLLASSSEAKVNVSRERKANSTTTRKNASSSQVFHSLEPSIRNYLEEYSPYVANKRKVLEENLDKLEKLTEKNMSARLGLLHVQQRMMELGVKDIMSSGKLPTIREDEALYFEDLQRLRDNPIDTLAQKYEQHSVPKLASVSF
jgi:hypothetical protein